MDFSKLRGSGLKYTASYIGRFSGLWLLVTVAAILVASSAVYLAFAEMAGGPGNLAPGLVATLLTQTVLVILAVVVLAVFATHRLAGPWIGVRRACERVRDGDLDVRLKIRSADSHLREVEEEFNAMVESIRRRIDEAESASRTGEAEAEDA